MTMYVFDSSAVIRYLDNEAGSDRVELIIKECIAGRVGVLISAVQWGEVAGNIRKSFGSQREAQTLSGILAYDLEIVPATGERAVRAADLKVDRKISYADAFALELSMESADHVLVTADYGFKAVDDLARIEFLPAK